MATCMRYAGLGTRRSTSSIQVLGTEHAVSCCDNPLPLAIESTAPPLPFPCPSSRSRPLIHRPLSTAHSHATHHAHSRPFRHAARPRGRHVRPHDLEGATYDAGRQALLSGRLSRRRPRGGFSDLGQFALGGRMPRQVDARHVLQGPRRLSRNELRPAARYPQDPRGLRRRRGRRLRPRRSACRSRATSRSGCSRRCWRSSASGSPTRPCGRWSRRS